MKNSECRIGRRDFLKCCGITLGGLGAAPSIARKPPFKPNKAQEQIVEQLETKRTLTEPSTIAEPESQVHWDRFAYFLDSKERRFTSNVDEITCRHCKESYELEKEHYERLVKRMRLRGLLK